MLIASFLAIVIHIGFMNFGFDPKPVLVPSVSLPRSVSVFLGQRNMNETSVSQTEKAQTVKHVSEKHVSEEQAGREIEPKEPYVEKVFPVKNSDNPLQQPALSEIKVTQSAVDKIMPVSQRPEGIGKDLLPEPGKAAKAQESTTPAEHHAVWKNDGTTLPGTLQMAYPRYQLNAPPAYPALARKRGQAGTVILQVLVNEKGGVDDLEIENSSGFGLLDRAAESAVRKWNFEPGRRGDLRIPMWVRVPVTFKFKK
jgi:protein TonB